MYVIKETASGLYVADEEKTGSEYTADIALARQFRTEAGAKKASCPDSEEVVKVA
jgi:hypothetical protein